MALVLGLLLALAPAALAHDSDAPPGAPHAWLPKEDWVMEHWIPFDERRLYAALDIDNRALEAWMRDDHHTIAALAEQRSDMSLDALADHLVAPWHGRVGTARFGELRRRTVRVLTQGHLAQHVFFHYFHGTVERSRRIFGVHPKVYQRLRQRGLTPVEVGRRGGRSPAHVRREMEVLLRLIADRGVRRRAHSREQASYMLRRRMALLGCFLRRPLPKHDPGNPYGDPNNGHGPHARGDRRGLRPGSKREHAHHHSGSCWREPRL